MPRLTLRRRDRLLLLAVLASATYWLAVWLRVGAIAAEADRHGTHPLYATLEANTLVYRATWVWVVGALGVHALGLLVGGLRRDREVVAGLGGSLLVHALFAVVHGVIRPW